MGRILFVWLGVMFHVNLSCADIAWKSVAGDSGRANCYKENEQCLDSGEKEVDGIVLSKPCWKFAYKKKCNFPSKNDCDRLKDCYEVGLKECLVKDAIGNCVNQKKEFSCKERDFGYVDKDRVKMRLKGDEATRIVCKGVPCIDGNCVDKSYLMDKDILESISKLKGIENIKGELFGGTHDYCRKKPVGYMSCCGIKGWGKSLGARCNLDEISLQKKRRKNLCVYVGKSTTGTKPFHVNKRHFCCFGNLFNKVFQTQARKQLGVDFGDGYGPDCGGLSVEEISSLDFNKMDFSEFSHEITKQMKLPSNEDITLRISSAYSDVDRKTGLKK